MLADILKIKNIKIDGFEELFQAEQEGFLDKGQIIHLPAGERFILVENPVNAIWILLSGTVKAIEEFHTGDIFAFNRFVAPEAFGEMELLSDTEFFKATLITETPCVFLNLSIESYRDFLGSHSKFLYARTKIILKRYFEDQKRLRTFLMIKAADRVKIYLTSQYELNAKEDLCILKIPRQQMAEEIGYAAKTINRAIKELESQNLLKIEGQKIIISKSQNKEMFQAIENYIA